VRSSPSWGVYYSDYRELRGRFVACLKTRSEGTRWSDHVRRTWIDFCRMFRTAGSCAADTSDVATVCNGALFTNRSPRAANRICMNLGFPLRLREVVPTVTGVLVASLAVILWRIPLRPSVTVGRPCSAGVIEPAAATHGSEPRIESLTGCRFDGAFRATRNNNLDRYRSAKGRNLLLPCTGWGGWLHFCLYRYSIVNKSEE
jgi:hypothetical protein